MLRKNILSLIDFFYPPFRKIMPLQTFRYAACGGGTMILDILIYSASFNYILKQEILDLGFIAFKPHIAALWMAFCISFPVGFLLSKYIVFDNSNLRGGVQLFRYVLVVAINLLMNYAILKVMVEYFLFWPTIARAFAVVIIVTFSYLSQKHFTFREKGKRKGIGKMPITDQEID